MKLFLFRIIEYKKYKFLNNRVIIVEINLGGEARATRATPLDPPLYLGQLCLKSSDIRVQT